MYMYIYMYIYIYIDATDLMSGLVRIIPMVSVCVCVCVGVCVCASKQTSARDPNEKCRWRDECVVSVCANHSDDSRKTKKKETYQNTGQH